MFPTFLIHFIFPFSLHDHGTIQGHMGLCKPQKAIQTKLVYVRLSVCLWVNFVLIEILTDLKIFWWYPSFAPLKIEAPKTNLQWPPITLIFRLGGISKPDLVSQTKNSPNLSQTIPCQPEWYQMVHNGIQWCPWYPMVSMVPNSIRWCPMVPNGT